MADSIDHGRQVGADIAEIEITPQMIEAGIAVLIEDYPDTVIGDASDARLVARLFAAMECASDRKFGRAAL